MNNKELQESYFHYDKLCSLWRDFCKLHTDLYDNTCSEYIALLESNIEKISNLSEVKNKILHQIKIKEDHRHELLKEINIVYSPKKPMSKLSELIELFEGKLLNSNQLSKFNLLLINIIEKVRDQNKVNRQFLNKAIISLDEIKKSFLGANELHTYGPKGEKRRHLSK